MAYSFVIEVPCLLLNVLCIASILCIDHVLHNVNVISTVYVSVLQEGPFVVLSFIGRVNDSTSVIAQPCKCTV